MRWFSGRGVVGLLVAVGVSAAAQGQAGAYQNFPEPGPGAYGVVFAPLTDGRLFVWNGDTLYVQLAVDADYFSPLASGYTGDPAFVAISPDGQTAALGAGSSGTIYLANTSTPGAPQVAVNTSNNYSGVWLSNTQLLINRAVYLGPGPFDYDAPELVLIDFTGAPVFKAVVDNVGVYSASITTDSTRQYVYAADGLTGETRRFSVADLITAFNTDVPLAWTSGVLIGTFNSGGPSAVDNSGNLIVGGFGSIQIVDPGTGSVVGAYDPVGTGLEFYFAGYNPFTGEILAIQSTYGVPPTLWTPGGLPASVPAAGPAALVMLCAGLLLLGAFRVRWVSRQGVLPAGSAPVGGRVE